MLYISVGLAKPSEGKKFIKIPNLSATYEPQMPMFFFGRPQLLESFVASKFPEHDMGMHLEVSR